MNTTVLTTSQRQLLGRWLQATHLHQEKRQQDIANDLDVARTSVSRLYSGQLKRVTLYKRACEELGYSLAQSITRAKEWDNGLEAASDDATESMPSVEDTWKLAIINNKGGVGKTATCLNLAGAYHRVHGKRVLLIDLDPQGNLTKSLTTEGDSGASLLECLDLLLEGQTCTPTVIETESGIDILAGGNKLKQVDRMDTTVTSALTDLLESIPKTYDVIIFDTPGGLGNLTTSALKNADHACIVTTAEPLATDGIPECVAAIRFIKRDNQKLELLGIIPNNVRAQLRVIERTNLKDIRSDDSWGHLVTESIIYSRVSIVESYYGCQTIFEYSPKSKSAREYTQLVKELEERRHE